jgi:thiaminase
MGNQSQEKIRARLAPLNVRVLSHPYISDAEKGVLPVKKVQTFVANQHYIVSHDARSLALMVSRSTNWDEFEFFSSILKGDETALPLLLRMAEALELTASDLEEYTPIPEAVVYAHYLTTLAHFASPGEQAIALTVNLPVWGANCKRLASALKEQYAIAETSFLDLFAQPTGEIERAARAIIDRSRYNETRLERVARLIQAYELMFWDGIYSDSG